MLRDRYDNPLTTRSEAARTAYDAGMDTLLAAQTGAAAAFSDAIAADDSFALAYVGLARAQQTAGDGSAARATMRTARARAGGVTAREDRHIAITEALVTGQSATALDLVKSHVQDYPRDALVAGTATSVFGLIGFSGQTGREAAQLAFNAALLPHYGEDWWCLSQYAFALCETGQLDLADRYIERSLALNPRNAGGAHIRSHVWYEAGETAQGRSFLADWMTGYDHAAVLHGHLSWHLALWALEQGDLEAMWQFVRADVMPGVAEGLPINVLTDSASILSRAEMAGHSVPPDLWRAVSTYASAQFPSTGNAFVDIHAALAHAMAGEPDRLDTIIQSPSGPAADLVGPIALGFAAIAAQDWEGACGHLVGALADHARIGGSRAQRDLLEHALTTCLLRQGRAAEAETLLQLRRPVLANRLN